MRAFWIIYGSLDQLTGGYIYDRLILEGAPQAGAVRVNDFETATAQIL